MKRVPSPSKRRRRRVTLPLLEPVEVKCAFCRGKGKDPFGIMSKLSTCCVCGGKGSVTVVEPYFVCCACSGTGVEPFSRLTCLACRGKGVMTVAQPTETCPVCKGTGLHTSHFYCLRCHGGRRRLAGFCWRYDGRVGRSRVKNDRHGQTGLR